MSVFINRERELNLLKDRYKSNRAEFLFIYGRRRVGKSELIEQFLKEKGIRGIRLLAREESKKLQLNRFKEKLANYFNDNFLRKTEFSDWDSFFEYVLKKSKDRLVIAIDEFPYLVKEDKSLPSVIQDYWDSKLKKTKVFLIFLGSSIRMMESFMNYKNPLYGRRTGQILLKPLKFVNIFNFINNINKAIQFYSVFGGTPAYFVEIDPKKTIEKNIKQKILREDSFIYRDVEFILREELEEPRYYFSILLSIAKGNHTIGLICNDTGVSKSIVNKYLSVLIDLQLVKRIIPVTASYKSKKGLYVLADNLFDFWFRFVYPNTDLLESEKEEIVLEQRIKPFLNSYIGKHFEDIIIEILKETSLFNFNKIGKWWHKDKEIDIVALNEQNKEILFGECKWKNRINAGKIIKELSEKAGYVKWHNDKRKEIFAIFAKSFSKKINEWEGKKVYCFDLRDVKRLLNTKTKIKKSELF